MLSKFIFLLSLSSALAFARGPQLSDVPQCEFLIDGRATSLEQQAILREARRSYKLVGLERYNNGERQFVLLAGETHLKTTRASDRGKKLIEQYSRFGLENASMTNSLPMRISYPIHEVVRWTLTTFLRLKDSSLKDAKNYALANPETHQYLPLEEGHVPDFAEKLELLKAPAILALTILDYHISDAENYALYSTMLTAPAVYFFAEIMLAWKYHSAKWYRKWFPTSGGILIGRNETMVGNLLSYIEENAGKDTLVIVGAGHVSGLSSILTTRHGFALVDLPDPK